MYGSTGVCGADVAPDIIHFDAMLSALSRHGVRVVRYNFGLQPLAFAENAAVKRLLIQEGTKVLPVILCDGEVSLKGRYPTGHERLEWFQASTGRLERAGMASFK